MKIRGMNTIQLAAILLFIVGGCGNKSSEKPSKTTTFMNSRIIFVEETEAAKLLSTSDEFTQVQSAFDFASKTNNVEGNQEQDYLTYAGSQAQAWTEKEIEETKKVIEEADAKIKEKGIELSLPDVIKLVKSTIMEEGGAAGYTRGNYIVFKTAPGIHLFLHELFHVFSRANPVKRDAFYNTISFQKMDRLSYPKQLSPSKITNPDAPHFEHFLTVQTADGQKDVVIITNASKPYAGGSFFEYFELLLLVVEGEGSDKSVVMKDDMPVTRAFRDALDFREKVGNNTNYIIHPEEILAEHFTMIFSDDEVRDRQFISSLEEILKN